MAAFIACFMSMLGGFMVSLMATSVVHTLKDDKVFRQYIHRTYEERRGNAKRF